MTAPLHEDDPLPGYYERRLVAGGPWLPARIWWEMAPRVECDECGGVGDLPMHDEHGREASGWPERCWECRGTGRLPDGDDILRCTIAGEERDPFEQWTHLARHPITEAEYNLRLAQRRWDIAHDPRAPAATQAVDWLSTSPKF